MNTSTAILAALAILPAGAGAQSLDTTPDSVGPIAVVYRPIRGDTTKPPADFVDVDKAPVVITKVEPEYPALALKAGIEGKVWVKIWVDSKGDARDVVILKSDADIFNASAIKAASQFKFEPAQIKGKPVDVWVSVPFRYRVAEKVEIPTQNADSVSGEVPSAVTNFVRRVLVGPVPDSAVVHSMVTENAQSIAGGYLKPLRVAIAEQRKGQSSLEQPGRTVASFTYGMAEGGGSGYLVARTEKKSNWATVHYHTVVFGRDVTGAWKVMCWQSWQGGRTAR